LQGHPVSGASYETKVAGKRLGGLPETRRLPPYGEGFQTTVKPPQELRHFGIYKAFFNARRFNEMIVQS
jgi:hypothetical protein